LISKMVKLRKFFHLSLAERGLFLKALGWLVLMRLGLCCLPFPGLLRFVARLSRTPNIVLPADAGLLKKIAWAVKTASAHIPGATCLTQALAAQTMLKSRGFPADLRIGVAKDDHGCFQAHAWLVSGDRVIIGGEEHENFVPFGSIGTPATLPAACS
jgi:hypothetical protein